MAFMITVVLGLLALSLVIFIHELGHFIAARISGVTVISFSIGWGPVLFRKRIGDTEYRISALPIGGYCNMKGEHDYRDAIEKDLDRVSSDPETFYGTRPLKRLFIAFAGPLFNLIFAVLVFTLVSASGYEYETWGNRIVLASDYTETAPLPADLAGFKSGDRIIAFDETPVTTFSDIQQYVTDKAGKNLSATVERDGMEKILTVIPELDKSTGAGRIGVYPWIPLVIGTVTEGSAADTSGIKPGDVLFEVNGEPVHHLLDFEKALESRPEQIVISLNREGIHLRVPLVLIYPGETGAETGIQWKTETVTVPGTGPVTSVANGLADTGRILRLTVKSIALLFGGVDVSQAVSGPVRITLMMGEVAQQGILALSELLGVICISLFLMNLLPVPVLDGGTVLFALVELVMRKPLRPRIMYRIQFIGIGFILFVFIFALLGDIRYLIQ